MDWGNVIVGFVLAVAGGIVASVIGGWSFYAGGIGHAAGALIALRGIVGPELDAAPASVLVFASMEAIAAAALTPFVVRFLIQGDPWRPTAGRGLRPFPIRFAWGRSRFRASSRTRRDYSAYSRAPQEV